MRKVCVPLAARYRGIAGNKQPFLAAEALRYDEQLTRVLGSAAGVSVRAMSNDFSTDVGKRCPDCGLVFATGLPHICRDANVTADQSEKAAALAKQSVAADSSDLVGVVLGERYKILEPLGKGGMGVVYKAQHTLLNSLLAVKILLYAQDEEAKTRFLREARIASQIQHPNTVFISDYGLLPDGRPYIVMEFLQGPTLRDLLERGAMDPLRACLIGAQITRGLQTVHEKGIVHRDRFVARSPAINSNHMVCWKDAGQARWARLQSKPNTTFSTRARNPTAAVRA